MSNYIHFNEELKNTKTYLKDQQQQGKTDESKFAYILNNYKIENVVQLVFFPLQNFLSTASIFGVTAPN